MQRRNEGHPLAAMLLLFSMFAFAFVFHVVTRPVATVTAHFDRQLAALPSAIAADVPESAVAIRKTQPIVVVVPPAPAAAVPFTAASPTTDIPPSLAAGTWSTMQAPLAGTIVATPASIVEHQGGAVVRALDTTRTALRSAFRKAF